MLENEGRTDRIVRVAVGMFLLSLTFWGPHSWLGLFGLVPLLTGVVGFCPLYRVFGIDTLRRSGGGAPRSTPTRPTPAAPS